MEKTINIEEIIKDIAVHDYIDDDGDNMINLFKSHLRESYIDFGKQLLKLAAENAKSKMYSGDVTDFSVIDKQSILDTINQVI